MTGMKKRFLRIYYSSKTPFVCLLLSWAFFCFILNGQVAEEFRAVYQLWVTAISLFVAFGLLYYEVFDKERFEAKKEMSRRLKCAGEAEIDAAFRQSARGMWNSPRGELSLLFLLWAIFAVIISDYQDSVFIGVSLFVVCCFVLNVYNHCKKQCPEEHRFSER